MSGKESILLVCAVSSVLSSALSESEVPEEEAEPEVEEKEETVQQESNHNAAILELHRQGASEIEIAKELGLGVGEVKLVLGLFREEEA